MTQSVKPNPIDHFDVARILDRVKIPVSVADNQLRYIWVNDAFADLVRYERSELIGLSILDVAHPDDRGIGRERADRVVSGELPYFACRRRYVCRDGSIVATELLAATVYHEGEPIGAMALVTDAAIVDPQTQRIETLQRSAAIGQLTASAVHEIRSSLGAMSLISQTLSKAVGPDGALPLLRQEIDASQALLSSIATFARPPLSPPPIEAPMFSVAALIDQTRALLDLVVPQGTRLTIDIEDESLFPNIEPREFQQVIINLVLNARDATGGGDGEIAITAQRTPGDAGFVDVLVTDNGVGMSPEDVDKAFEPYFTTKGEDGTGLGLTISRDIVLRHGGSLLLDSSLGKGSQFIVRLPLAPLRTA